ncbi:MAG TPA: carboxypeptidase regulatory-like domain-containing protein [Polyangiaceae bacterium]|jgi:hypothetical protein
MRQLLFIALALFPLACGSTDDNFGGVDAGVDSSVKTDGGFTFGDGGGSDASTGCVNLQCQVVQCGGGQSTTVSGTVVTATPAQYGAPDPIYNAIVYVPNAPLDPFPPGVACDKCGTPVSGNPVALTLSDVKGHFTLKDVPVGTNIPLVVQIGRWRRQTTISTVNKCVDNPVDTSLTRIPRDHTEGDIPHIAIATSTFDAEECILLKMGVAVSEFTASTGTGRIHLYHGTGATLPGVQDMSALWASDKVMDQYDVALFPCESVPAIGSSPGAAGQVLLDFLNAGGRAFATDLSYSWYKDGPAPLPSSAQWTTWGGFYDPLPAIIDQSFPKGQALAEWLQYLGETTTQGNIDLHETYHVVDGVNAPTSRWLYSTSPATVQTISFNTPIGKQPADQCGRAVYSNFHIANGQSSSGTTFPSACDPNPLTGQEKIMEFMLFDLSSCVQDDTKPPIPPVN